MQPTDALAKAACTKCQSQLTAVWLKCCQQSLHGHRRDESASSIQVHKVRVLQGYAYRSCSHIVNGTQCSPNIVPVYRSSRLNQRCQVQDARVSCLIQLLQQQVSHVECTKVVDSLCSLQHRDNAVIVSRRPINKQHTFAATGSRQNRALLHHLLDFPRQYC